MRLGTRDCSSEMVIALANLSASLRALVALLPHDVAAPLAPVIRAPVTPRAAGLERVRLGRTLQAAHAALRAARGLSREDVQVAALLRHVEDDVCIAAGVLHALEPSSGTTPAATVDPGLEELPRSSSFPMRESYPPGSCELPTHGVADAAAHVALVSRAR